MIGGKKDKREVGITTKLLLSLFESLLDGNARLIRFT